MFGSSIFLRFRRRESAPDLSKGERVTVLSDWPQPAVAPQPKVLADDCSLSVCYHTDKDRFAVIRFPLCHYFIFGAPNDEALGGHPLARRGLKFHSVHEVHDSSLILLLERRNAVHHRHERSRFLHDKKHYIITFQDSTLECVVTAGEPNRPVISIFETEEQADQFWRTSTDESSLL